ncbi:MAG: hypothetical protein HC824_20160, partial [Synechococcales cyanobacterium RM1_1_8]|nr:hypothetical protein [Synechococcales cyanobacterium RM1_1_8]
GAVQVTQLKADGALTADEATTLAVLCEATVAGKTVLTNAAINNYEGDAIADKAIKCGTGVKAIK